MLKGPDTQKRTPRYLFAENTLHLSKHVLSKSLAAARSVFLTSHMVSQTFVCD